MDSENAIVKDSAHPGGLYNLSTYIHWLKSDEKACLDSEFTVADLRAIADYMDENYEPEEEFLNDPVETDKTTQ